MRRDDMETLLEGLDFWNALSPSQRQLALDSARVCLLQKGQPFEREHAGQFGVTMILAGRLQLAMLSEGGRKIVLWRLGAGDACVMCAGDMLREFSYNVWVEVEEDTQALVILRPAFELLMGESQQVSLFVYRLMTERFSEALWTIQNILFLGLDKRLAEQLLYLASEEEADVIHRSHESLAWEVGCTREAVSRMLKRFEDESLISRSRSAIRLLDKRRLQQLGSAP